MKNTTKDIINRALQLADLEGSNFVSWKENQSLLNENYTELYQKLVNKGDKSFLKEFRCAGNSVYALPLDFMQLKGVYMYNNGNLHTVERRAENGNINNIGYEIKNGKLYLYGYSQDILVQYFPSPKYLTTKPEPIEIALPDDVSEVVACWEHRFVYWTSDSALKIVDIDTDSKAEIMSAGSSATFIMCGKNLVYIQTSNGNFAYDIESGRLYEVTFDWVSRAENGNLYPTKEGKICLFCTNGDDYYLNPFADVPENCSSGIVSDDYFEDCFYFIDDDLYHNGKKIVENITANDYAYRNGILYFLNGNALFKIKNDEVLIVASSLGDTVAFTGINNNTGFGLLSKSMGKNVIKPYAEDVILNYPSSFFFDILAYQLAVAYKAKQGADYSQLAQQLSAMTETFFDTLGNDDFGNTRITNVYY